MIDFFGRREQKRFASPWNEEEIFFFSAEAGREGGEVETETGLLRC